jgi:glycopeptide antibiotics resistance protein
MTREISVPRWVTVLFFLLVTGAVLTTTIYVSGASYSKVDPVPFEDVRHLAERLEHRATSTQVLAILVMPIVANVLLFVPWAFLLFIVLYNPERPTVQTYVLTILLGLSFTLAIEAWQYFLPSRVADINDIIWNTAGTILGAILGHLRMRVRFEFD